ncbi:MAG: rod shape-determining protein MreD [Bacteroides sp.]|nr:rod shape-determining protein MreD [Roseburia sp.]MCM1346380.1 rod shape-determining protein MreD [Bacteroides sp.]MCM1420115.1 rod shape-determining protein MreD [Bacteroides sp.]
MSNSFIFRLFRLIILLAVQVLILNHLHLLGYATPLVFGYMLTSFRAGTSRIGILLWGFVTGMLFDMCTNTSGIGAASCTLLAMIQPPLLRLFIPRDAPENFEPLLANMGLGRFFSYTLIAMFVFHAAFFFLDAFSLADWVLTAISIFGGTVLSAVIILFVELLIRRKVR